MPRSANYRGSAGICPILITLFLIERQRLSQPLLYLSEYIEAHQQTYYDLLQRVRTDGDWYAWIMFFLIGVRETSEAAVAQAAHLMDLRESLRAQLRRQGRALELVDHLFVNPFTTVSNAAHLLEVSDETARKAVGALVAKGVLEEVSGRSWGRLYLARSILSVLESP